MWRAVWVSSVNGDEDSSSILRGDALSRVDGGEAAKGGTCCVGVLLRERAEDPGKRNISFDAAKVAVGSSANRPRSDVGTLALRGDLWKPSECESSVIVSDMDRPLTVSNSQDSTGRCSDPERSLTL